MLRRVELELRAEIAELKHLVKEQGTVIEQIWVLIEGMEKARQQPREWISFRNPSSRLGPYLGPGPSNPRVCPAGCKCHRHAW